MFHQITEGVAAQYSLNKAGQICITFSDPVYVRSDKIIFDRRDSSLRAVLNEGLHLIGKVDPSLTKIFMEQSEVVLTAPHYFSGTVNFKTPLIVN